MQRGCSTEMGLPEVEAPDQSCMDDNNTVDRAELNQSMKKSMNRSMNRTEIISENLRNMQSKMTMNQSEALT